MFQEFIKNITFNKDNKVSTLSDKIDLFNDRINKIVENLIRPYIESDTLKINNNYLSLSELIDTKKCNDFTILLSNEIEKEFKRVELSVFNSKILIGKKNDDDKNKEYIIDGKRLTKSEICDKIALYYIRIFNVIASILTSVNPKESLCFDRLRKLYISISNDSTTGISNICSHEDKNKLFDEKGMKPFLYLYYLYLMEENDKNTLENVQSEYSSLLKDLSYLIEKNEDDNITKFENKFENDNTIESSNKINDLDEQILSINNSLNDTNDEPELQELPSELLKSDEFNDINTISKGGSMENNLILDKFINFMNDTGLYDKMDSNLMDMLNYKMIPIPSYQIDEICKNVEKLDTNTKEIKLDLNDESLKEFLDNYTNVKNAYINNCEKLLDILETKIMELESSSDESKLYKLSNINQKQLYEIENEVRNIIKTMIVECQTGFNNGVNLLYEYFRKKNK